MESICQIIQHGIDFYEMKNKKKPDYIVLGWDLVYEVRLKQEAYSSRLSEEYVFGIRILETNTTGIIAIGTKI